MPDHRAAWLARKEGEDHWRNVSCRSVELKEGFSYIHVYVRALISVYLTGL
jgi:hypothetical protein